MIDISTDQLMRRNASLGIPTKLISTNTVPKYFDARCVIKDIYLEREL